MIGSGALEIQGIGLAEVHAYGYEIRSSVSTGCMCEQQELPELHRLATSSTRHMLLFGNGHRNGMIWIFPKPIVHDTTPGSLRRWHSACKSEVKHHCKRPQTLLNSLA